MKKILAIILLATGVYLNTLNWEFVYDDRAIIVGNPTIKQTDIKKILTAPYWKDFPETTYRPLAMTSYAANYYFGGLNPFGYHLVNIILHALNSAIAFLVMRRFVKERTAFFAALLFAAHPIHTEAVANIVGRAELLAAFLEQELVSVGRRICGISRAIVDNNYLIDNSQGLLYDLWKPLLFVVCGQD